MSNSKSLLSKSVKSVSALAVGGLGLLAFAGSASAASEISANAVCDGDKTSTTFTVEIGKIDTQPGSGVSNFQTTRWTVTYNGTKIVDQPASVTSFTVVGLPSGDLSFDWGDTITYVIDATGVTETKVTASHVALGAPYKAVVETVPTCVTTTVPAPTTTVAAPTTTVAAPTTTIVANPPTTVTGTTIVANPPTTAAPTTAVVQTTAAVSANTLPATGAASTAVLGAAGAAFLGLGGLALHATRRRPTAR